MDTKEVKFAPGAGASGGGVSGKPGPAFPKDGQVMMSILKDMGVTEFDPRVVNQLLEFSYRYATNILEDSKVLSNHAKKSTVDIDDVKLAVSMYAEQNLTSAPSRETLLDMARIKNNTPLPPPRKNSGMRLPPDRHCLTACNYRLKFKPKPGRGGSGTNMSHRGATSSSSLSSFNMSRKMPAAATAINSATKMVAQVPGVGMDPPQFVIGTGAAVPKPTIKMNMAGTVPPPKIQMAPQQPVFKMSIGDGGGNMNGAAGSSNSMKRKADDGMAGFQ